MRDMTLELELDLDTVKAILMPQKTYEVFASGLDYCWSAEYPVMVFMGMYIHGSAFVPRDMVIVEHHDGHVTIIRIHKD